MNHRPVDRPLESTAKPVQPDPLDDALAELSTAEAQAVQWLVRRQDGWDATQEARFQDWLAADPSHQAAFDDMAGVWQGLDEIPDEGVKQLRAGLENQDRLATPHPPAVQVQPTRRPGLWQLRPWMQPALLASLAGLVVGGSWLAWEHWRSQPVFSQHYASARGQQTEVSLPDGSQLRLDTQTDAQVVLYRQRRTVHLREGQVLLQVQGDSARPFDVEAGNTRITVTGTRFSVRYTPSIPPAQVQIAVEEGRVHVARAGEAAPTGSGDGAALELTAGQSVTADAEGRLGSIARVTSEGVAPWRNQRVNFDDTPLARALAELERYGNTGLVVHDPAVAALRVSGSVDLRRLGDFARTLTQVLPVRTEARDGTQEVVAR